MIEGIAKNHGVGLDDGGFVADFEEGGDAADTGGNIAGVDGGVLAVDGAD